MSAQEPSGPAAQAWYVSAAQVNTYAAFEKRFMELPRRLFIEVALRRCGSIPLRVLDVGCGTGSGLLYLRERLPHADLVGIDVSAAMLGEAHRRLCGNAALHLTGIDAGSLSLGQFDLILSHSNMRLWRDPCAGLRAICGLLAADGLAYVLDLRRDVPDDVRARVLAGIDDPAFRELYAAQLSAARTVTEVHALLALAGVAHYSLKVGPTGGVLRGGMGARSADTDPLAACVNAIRHSGLAGDMAQIPLHLFIYPGRSAPMPDAH